MDASGLFLIGGVVLVVVIVAVLIWVFMTRDRGRSD
jgi:cbb3-type cytochrome oxidase subunit 3